MDHPIKLTVPRYIYAGRPSDRLRPVFEEHFFRQAQHYDDSVMGDPEAYETAKRIGYAFCRITTNQMLKMQGEGRYPKAPALDDLGNEGFNWKFDPRPLHKDANVLSFGIGTDISFEEALTEKFGCAVHCFDPTPQAMEHAIKVRSKNRLINAYPYGILSEDRMLSFFKPADPKSGSLSASNLGVGTSFIEVPVMRLRTIMLKLKIDEVDLLKIDIEGSEYAVIDDLVLMRTKVKQICVEFDQPIPPWRTERAFQKLYLAGYTPVEAWGLNWLFVHNSMLDEAPV